MNNVQIIGRLTKDVDLRYINGAQGQTAVGSFTVAVDRPPKQDGTREADFISCQAWGKKAEVIQQYFQKGSKIGIVGRIRTGSYQNQQGATVYTTDVEVSDIDFLDPKAAQQPNPTTPAYTMQQGQNYYQAQAQQVPVPQQYPQQYQQYPQQYQQPVQQPKPARGRKPAAKAPTNVTPAQAMPPMQQPQPVPQVQEEFLNLDMVQDEGLPFK